MRGWRSKKRWISTDARATRSRRHGLRSYSRDCQPDLAKAEDQRPVAKLAESLLDHDEGFRLWRLRHVEIGAQIGNKPGTGVDRRPLPPVHSRQALLPRAPGGSVSALSSLSVTMGARRR